MGLSLMLTLPTHLFTWRGEVPSWQPTGEQHTYQHIFGIFPEAFKSAFSFNPHDNTMGRFLYPHSTYEEVEACPKHAAGGRPASSNLDLLLHACCSFFLCIWGCAPGKLITLPECPQHLSNSFALLIFSCIDTHPDPLKFIFESLGPW